MISAAQIQKLVKSSDGFLIKRLKTLKSPKMGKIQDSISFFSKQNIQNIYNQLQLQSKLRSKLQVQ